MSEDSAHEDIAVPIAASLAEFTDKLIARRGVEQSDLLFGGQIGPATKALSARTNSIGVGDKTPDFSLPTAEGGIWNLGEHLAQGKSSSLVVVFYRGTWCGYCNIYLRGLLEAQSLLSDGKIAEQFGLTFEMDDAAKNILKGSGFNLEERNADRRWVLPVPGTFVIDRSGHIAYAHVDADYRNRPEPQEIVAMCRSLRR